MHLLYTAICITIQRMQQGRISRALKIFSVPEITKKTDSLLTIKVCRCVIESWIIKSVVIKTTGIEQRIVVFHVKRLVDFFLSAFTRSDGSRKSPVHFRGFGFYRCILKGVSFTWRSTWFPCHIIYQKI